ncbi:hypothetical protein THRCLA_02003 [Thraustotheca clavata]|uniref:AB hydrolase-1 domain-containing protein n=1 Tax=Thraustotheca clavata TaxID=74557 RepID=A0A1W0A6L9_9STRA|nr:hypothetical protein THRCLA_02003 [Thraustotheca clavata]
MTRLIMTQADLKHSSPEEQPQPEIEACASFSDSESSDDMDMDRVSVVIKASCLAEQMWEPFRTLVINPLTTMIYFALINSVFILIWMFLAWMAELLTRPGLFLLVIGLFVVIARSAALILSYPGHLRIVTRDCERNFAKMLKKWMLLTATTTDNLIQILLSPEPFNKEKTQHFVDTFETYQSCIKNIVVVLVKALEIVDTEETLCPNGKHILSHLRVYMEYHEKLAPSFTKLATSSDMEAERKELDLDSTLVEFGVCIEDLRDVVEYFGEPAGTPKRSGIWGMICELILSRFSPLKIVACLSLMRADLIVRHNGRQVWVHGLDKNEIDCMFIPGTGLSPTNTERTIILCNPNCGLYEFHHFQSDWIQFYTKLGINVFLFNYRGYGRTKGYPSPEANNRDGMAIVSFLYKDCGIKRIAIHGESIGGMVATYVAKNAEGIELLIADRTFANLPAVAQRLVASWAGSALSCVTRWQTDNVSNYLEASCNKLVCCDPCDEIVADSSSLKAGIALRLELGDTLVKTPKAPQKSKIQKSACASLQYEAIVMTTDIVHGKPLNEAIMAQFTESLLRLADRAQRAMDGDVQCADMTAIDMDDFSRGKCLIDIWSAVASLDGHCGQTLFHAIGGGLEGIRAWTSSFIVWGPSTRIASIQSSAISRQDFIKPLSLEHVRILLHEMLKENDWLHDDKDIAYILEILEYLYDAMHRQNDKNIGSLLPLSCGHNANFSDHEKAALVAYLISFQWVNINNT